MGYTHSSPKPPCSRAQLSLLPPFQSQLAPCDPGSIMTHLPAGPKWGTEPLPRRAVLTQECSLPRREERRAGMEEGPAGAIPGLAVLYGFLFLCDFTAHSYRDWSRGARRGQTTEGSDPEQASGRAMETGCLPLPKNAANQTKVAMCLFPCQLLPNAERGRGLPDPITTGRQQFCQLIRS